MRVLFFDTESTDLKAMMGRLLCASFVSTKGKPYCYRSDVAPWTRPRKIDDSKLAVAIREELEGADMIVGWNSILHDVPLVNARLAKAGERPIKAAGEGGPMHLDLMWYAGGNSLKIGSRKLDNVAKFFDLKFQKTALDWESWQEAGTGDKKAMNKVVEHCNFDVLVLREAWPHLAPRVKKFQLPLNRWWHVVDQL